MRSVFSFLFIFVISISNGQNTDSLKQAFQNTKDDTSRCGILNLLIENEYNEEVWMKYNTEVIDIARKGLMKNNLNSAVKKSLYDYLVNALFNDSERDMTNGNYPVTLRKITEGCEIAKKSGNKQQEAFGYGNIGYVYNQLGNIPLAIDYFYKSQKIWEEVKDTSGISSALINLGSIYEHQSDSLSAIKMYKQAANLSFLSGNKRNESYALTNLGVLEIRRGKVKVAYNHFKRSLTLRQEIADSIGIGNSLINLGDLFSKHGEPECKGKKEDCLKEGITKSIKFYQQAREIYKKLNYSHGLAYINHTLALVNYKNNLFQEAIRLGQESLAMAKEIGEPVLIRNAAEVLYLTFLKTKNYKLALAYYELTIQMKDSLNNDNNKQAAIKSQLKYEYEKKAAADSVRVAEEKKVSEVQLKQEKTKRYALYGGLSLVGVFALFMLNRFRVTNKQKKIIGEQKRLVECQKHIVEEKQKEILDSIHYARRIQYALISNEHYIHKNLKRLKE